MSVERSITRGNVLSMLTTVVTFGVTLVAVVLFIADIRRDFEKKDQEHDVKLAQIERELGTSRADHDLIIEMRADLKAIRQLIERAAR